MPRKNTNPASCGEGQSGHSREKIHVPNRTNGQSDTLQTAAPLRETRAGMRHTTSNLPRLGTRFALSGYIGTIRYVGEVEGTDGVWLGVEWDDSNRGKHNGTKDGKRYFTCQ